MVLAARNFWYSAAFSSALSASGFSYRGQSAAWASPSAAPQVHWFSPDSLPSCSWLSDSWSSCSGSASGFGSASFCSTCSSAGGVPSSLETAAALAPWSSETASATGSAMLATSNILTSSAHTFFIFIALPPYAFGQPWASVTVLPLLAVCTAWAATSTVAVAFWYSLPMAALKVTLVNTGSVTCLGLRGLL